MNDFVHHAALYDSSDAFLAMAAPFLTEGLAAGEPVLAVTTAANLELLHIALGADADRIDYAESAYFGRRPPQRVAAFERYRRRHAGAERVRIIAEPIWAGRSTADVSDWKRMESGLNVLLAGSGISMICPYDSRTVAADVAADARRTHPTHVAGAQVAACEEFVDPAEFAAAHAVPWPDPPETAALLPDARASRDVRRFAAAQAKACRLADEPANLLVMAVNEVAGYLTRQTAVPVTVRIWSRPDAIVSDLHVAAEAEVAAFPGYRTPQLEARDDDGLWYARQVCDRLEIRPVESGVRARLHFPTPHAAELREPGRAYIS